MLAEDLAWTSSAVSFHHHLQKETCRASLEEGASQPMPITIIQVVSAPSPLQSLVRPSFSAEVAVMHLGLISGSGCSVRPRTD